MTDTPEPKPEHAPVIKELSGKIGKYDILKPLGKGAMGMVYLAHDTILERDVALKVMVSQIADDPELKQRFEREAKAVARMTHPNVVNVFDLGSHTDGSPFIAMELLKGMDLQKAIRTPPPMELNRKVQIIVQVLAGLAHAHQAGIVHRDIKPANIFINQDGTVKIMDFGVARLTTASMTGTGNIVGTADYMSPEQVKGAKVDGRSDLFSVGCMLYELMAGRRPFHSDNLMAIFYKITHEEPNFDLIPAGEDYDALMPVLRKALAKNLEDRYQNAYDFAVDLREYLKSTATSVSGQHALEGLIDLEPPASGPGAATIIPLDDGEGGHGGTVDLSSGRGKSPTLRPAATVLGTRGGIAPTVVVADQPGSKTTAGSARTTVGSAPARAAVRPAPMTPRPVAQPSGGHPMLYVVLGGMGVLLLGLGGYIYISKQRPEPSPPPPVTEAPVTTTTLAPPPTTVATPPPTTAPPPSFGEAKGKGATAVRAAQAAFKDGNYDRAIAQAQAALAEDPGNGEAKRIAENALRGQGAVGHFKLAESALRDGDFARANNETDAGMSQAAWDSRGPDLKGRIQQAQARVQQQQQSQQQAQLAAQMNKLLEQAEAATTAQKYDAAIALYDEILKADPQNQRALLGKTSAVGARAVAQAASTGGGVRTGKTFVVGKTTAQSAETRSGGSVPDGFEDTAGVTVKKGTQAADLPGKITFDVDPDAVKSGEKYTVKIYMVNEGTAPISIKEMLLTTKINGRGSTGPVPTSTKDVAPGQKALLFQLPDTWKEETSSWSMEAVVRTVRGEKYTNQVTWK